MLFVKILFLYRYYQLWSAFHYQALNFQCRNSSPQIFNMLFLCICVFVYLFRSRICIWISYKISLQQLCNSKNHLDSLEFHVESQSQFGIFLNWCISWNGRIYNWVGSLGIFNKVLNFGAVYHCNALGIENIKILGVKT